eukprot:scaffold88486_cov29-Prasinocladus_malaysianus.AAC.1
MSCVPRRVDRDAPHVVHQPLVHQAVPRVVVPHLDDLVAAGRDGVGHLPAQVDPDDVALVEALPQLAEHVGPHVVPPEAEVVKGEVEDLRLVGADHQALLVGAHRQALQPRRHARHKFGAQAEDLVGLGVLGVLGGLLALARPAMNNGPCTLETQFPLKKNVRLHTIRSFHGCPAEVIRDFPA